jgi:hypothetical protein
MVVGTTMGLPTKAGGLSMPSGTVMGIGMVGMVALDPFGDNKTSNVDSRRILGLDFCLMDGCVTMSKSKRWTRGLVTKLIIAATNLCERTDHFVILGSQQDFGTFEKATQLKPVCPSPVVQSLRVYQ